MRKRPGGNGGRGGGRGSGGSSGGSGGGGGGGASLSFISALHAQRAALAAAPAPAPPAAPPPPPPAPRGFVYDAHTQRHWPASAAAGLKRRLAGSEPQQELLRAHVAQQQRLLGTHPRASALALLRSRELRACSSSSSSSSSSAQPSALRYLQGLLSSCVRAWEPTPPLQRLPGALASLELECTVPAALCAHPTRSGLAWNAAGGVAQLWHEAGASAWAFEAADSPVTALAWDASGSLLAHATLGGNGVCASLRVTAPAAARTAPASGGGSSSSSSSSSTASASATLRLPPAASVWGLAWLPDPGSDCGSTHLCLPLEAGGRAALVRRGAEGRQQQLLIERTFACGSGGRGSSDALAVGAAPLGSASSSASFLVGLRDGHVCLCDARAPSAPSPLARLPGPTAALSPLPSLSPYALMGAVTHCAERQRQPQRQPQRQHPPPTCTLWDVRSSKGPTAALAGTGAASFKHRPSVLAELGLVAAWAPGGGGGGGGSGGGAGLLQCWEAGAAGAAGGAADESLPPTWRAWLPGSGSGSGGGGLAQVHALAMRAAPGSGAELLLLGSAGGGEAAAAAAAAHGSAPPALVLQRFARSAARGFEEEVVEEEEEAMGGGP